MTQHLTTPAGPPALPANPARLGPGALHDATINILIVDDEPKNLLVLESLLDAPGYRLVRAQSANDALLALVAEEFALLILDIRMPGMSGFELAQTIKGRKKTASVPIIFLTAYYTEDQHIIEGYDSGAVDFLHKPVNPAVLRSKVAVFAELYRRGREIAAINTALLEEIVERREAEKQLVQLNTELDERVTERTHALSASNARLRLATDTVGLGIWSWQTGEDAWVWENDWFEVTLGVGRDQAPQSAAQMAERFVHMDDRAAFLQTIAASVHAGAAVNFEGRLRAADGSLHWIEFVGDRSAEPRSTGQLLGTARDTSERRRAEETLRERERFLSTVTGAARIGLAVIEPGDRVRFANTAYAQMLGLDADTLAGRPLREVLADGWLLAEPALVRAFAGERAAFEFTLAARPPDHRQRHFGAFLEPHLDTQGTRTVVVVVVEITELKQLEWELRDTDRRKDEFLATLAHELRNPLAPVRNAVQILQLTGPANRDLVWARDVIDRQVRMMARLIDDLMDVSRINQGRIELRRECIELAKVLDWAVEASRPQIEEHGHRLTLDLPQVPLLLDADLTRLSQVFMNLLTNAAKFTDRGGHITLAVRRQAGEVVVTVSDNGIGMRAEELHNVFVMFAQAKGAMTRSRGGLGIGLALAKRLIEMHGGHIAAASAGPGLGSEFIVTLPLRAPALADPAPSPVGIAGRNSAATGGLRIVVADDNHDGADTLAAVLSLIGHEVHTVYDGAAAVQAAEAFRPQVVLLDIGMPKLNGYEACRQIRDRPWGKPMTLIAMTGWGDAEARREVVDAGFDGHLIKPVDEQLLLQMLPQPQHPHLAETKPPAAPA